MKLQGLAIICAIILLPIIITLSYFIHKEVDTIALQTAYDTKLIDATHDAMASFELNTANEDLSSVADALRSIIEAANNTFFNSLATNLGMSNANKDYVRTYVPAILYTLYDGYYIYSPTRVPEILVSNDSDGNEKIVYVGDKGVTYQGINSKGVGVYTFNEDDFQTEETETARNTRQNNLFNSLPENNKYEFGQMLYKNNNGTYSPKLVDNGTSEENTKYNQDYVLKSYMPYSARYTGTDYDLTINYTLDNYITVMGNIGKVYYAKNGYLIGKDVVKSVVCSDIDNLLDYNEIDAERICLSGEHTITLEIEPYLDDGVSKASTIQYNYTPYPGNLSYSAQKERLNKCYEEIEACYSEYRNSPSEDKKNEITNLNNEVKNLTSSIQDLTAITYYVKSQIFSNWVYDNLGNIEERNINDILASNNESYTTEISNTSATFHHDFSNSTTKIFDGSKDPEWPESNFVNHKFNVIKNSIQYNINLALSGYDEMLPGTDVRMPVISDYEWQNILQRVSIVTFMQGINCGLKYYNNYAIVSSTNNELTVIPNEIYYTNKDDYNTGDFSTENPLYHRIDCPDFLDNDNLISFRSKEVKYDKIYDKKAASYKYDHKNFACYNCIVNSNYKKRLNSIEEGTAILGYNDNIIVSSLSATKQKAYFKALGESRQNLYKTNALPDSNGYEVVDERGKTGYELIFDTVNWILPAHGSRKLKELKAIEISFKNVHIINPSNNMLEFKIYLNDDIYIRKYCSKYTRNSTND